MATVRELTTRFNFKVDQAGLKKLNARIGDVKKSIAKVGAIAVGATAALFGIARSVAIAGDNAAKNARRLGLTAEALQELQFAADRAGVSQGEFNVGLRGLARAASEAMDGVATYKDAFDELGVTVVDQNDNMKTTDALLSDLADAFAKLPDGPRKTALAMQVMGRSGSQMITMLSGGSAEILKMRERARELGLVLDEETTKKSEEFIDSLTDLKAVLDQVRQVNLIEMLSLLP